MKAEEEVIKKKINEKREKLNAARRKNEANQANMKAEIFPDQVNENVEVEDENVKTEL